MLKSYLTIAFRNILKNRGTSLINLLGLTIGLASCLLIFIYVRAELSFDQFHSKADDLYRIVTIDEALGVTSNHVAITMPALAAQMKEEFPEVINSCRMSNFFANQIVLEDETYALDNLWLAEPAFLEMFDFQLLSGDRATALVEPNTAILSEETALRIFNRTDVVGEMVEINEQPVRINGILENSPDNSHLQYDLVLSMTPAQTDSNRTQFLNAWNRISMVSYLELASSPASTGLTDKMETMIRQHDVGDNFKVTLQAMEDIHLGSSEIIFDGYNTRKSDAGYVYTLLIVAIFVLMIAAFNYMNLATARSTKRAKEVGLRKVIGAKKHQLIIQFISEAVLLCSAALIVSIGIAGLVGEWLQLPLPANPVVYLFRDWPFLLAVILGVIALGVASGSYPAFMLSSFQPVKVLKGNFGTSAKGLWLRRALVVMQFAASTAMIIGTVIVYQQLSLLQNKDKGFDPQQIVTFSLSSREELAQYDAFSNELDKVSGVVGIATAGSMPGQGYGRNGINPEGYPEEDVWIVSVTSIDEHFIPVMGMEMADGRNFSPEFATDSTQSVLINEAMAEALGWSGEAVGKTITAGQELRVAGVVKDFHFNIMKHQIEPLMMYYNPGGNRAVTLKVDSRTLSETMREVESKWAAVNPGVPFEYTFFDEEFAQQFESEQYFSRLVLIFTWLAIFIACLGLLGLSAFAAEQRTKEIGVRKVLGASTGGLVQLLSRELSLLVVIAAALAIPISWYVMSGWLENYFYRIDMPWWVYPSAIVLALMIALFTNAYHAIRTAKANPVKALRSE